MKRLYFVRHGESEANVAQVFAGRFDTPLTPKGRAQAKVAGEQAKSLDIDHIVSSPLSRAHDTAVIIAEQIGILADSIGIDSALLERGYGPLQGMPYGTQSDSDLDKIVGVEPIDAVLARAKLAYQHLLTIADDTVLVVSHGAFWRALRTVIHPESPLEEGDEPRNAEIVQLL